MRKVVEIKSVNIYVTTNLSANGIRNLLIKILNINAIVAPVHIWAIIETIIELSIAKNILVNTAKNNAKI